MWTRIPAHWKFIAGLFLGAKVLLTLIGLMAIHAQEYFLRSMVFFDPLRNNTEAGKLAASTHEPVSMWFAWDGLVYWRLARDSLFSHGPDWHYKFAFPPLYPQLSRAVGWLLNGHTALAMLLVSNVAFVLLLYYAYRLAQVLFGDEDTARRFTRYVVLMPAGFIFQAPFTESLFLCLVLASFYYAERRKWLVAGALGFLFSLTRSYGFLVTLPLFLILLQQGGYRLQPRALWGYVKAGWPLLLVPAGWLSFMTYCRAQTGDWLRYQHEQQRGWQITTQNPLRTLWHGLIEASPTNTSQTWFAVIFLIITAIAIRYVKPAYIVYAVMMIMMPLSVGEAGYRSLIRYLVVVFPVFLVLAAWGRRREIDTYLTAGLALLQGALFVLWVNYWSYYII